MAKIIDIVRYGLARIKTKRLDDEYLNWLEFANAGMLAKGNLYSFNYAIENLPSDNSIVEIGSFCGLSTNIMSYLLKKHNKQNKIFSSDKWIFEGAGENKLGDSDVSHAEYREFVRDSFFRNVKMFSKDNLPFTIEEISDDFFAMWEENKQIKDVFERDAKLGGKISFCFIDGNHSYEYVKRDFENTDKFLEKGGFILFDDSADYYDFGSSKLMKEIKNNKNYRVVLKNPDYLIQKIK